MNEEYLSVKDFAAAAGCSTQYIYKILGTHLRPYKKKINKKTYIEAAAIELVKNGFSTDATLETNQMQPTAASDCNSSNQPTNQQETTEINRKEEKEENGEVEALKMLVEELKADKEYLKQEALKWQQLLADERNKVKLLEAAAAPIEKEDIVYREMEQEEPAAKEEKQELPQTFTEKIKWLFKKS